MNKYESRLPSVYEKEKLKEVQMGLGRSYDVVSDQLEINGTKRTLEIIAQHLEWVANESTYDDDYTDSDRMSASVSAKIVKRAAGSIRGNGL